MTQQHDPGLYELNPLDIEVFIRDGAAHARVRNTSNESAYVIAEYAKKGSAKYALRIKPQGSTKFLVEPGDRLVIATTLNKEQP